MKSRFLLAARSGAYLLYPCPDPLGWTFLSSSALITAVRALFGHRGVLLWYGPYLDGLLCHVPLLLYSPLGVVLRSSPHPRCGMQMAEERWPWRGWIGQSCIRSFMLISHSNLPSMCGVPQEGVTHGRQGPSHRANWRNVKVFELKFLTRRSHALLLEELGRRCDRDGFLSNGTFSCALCVRADFRARVLIYERASSNEFPLCVSSESLYRRLLGAVLLFAFRALTMKSFLKVARGEVFEAFFVDHRGHGHSVNVGYPLPRLRIS